ncbi:hypothetical protein, partial [Comamonas sp.]|uniref:hypothetical protein n=1 Tax=Comamonas sp. TaxID=34028 RepID=UPI0026482C9C
SKPVRPGPPDTPAPLAAIECPQDRAEAASLSSLSRRLPADPMRVAPFPGLAGPGQAETYRAMPCATGKQASSPTKGGNVK